MNDLNAIVLHVILRIMVVDNITHINHKVLLIHVFILLFNLNALFICQFYQRAVENVEGPACVDVVNFLEPFGFIIILLSLQLIFNILERRCIIA